MQHWIPVHQQPESSNLQKTDPLQGTMPRKDQKLKVEQILRKKQKNYPPNQPPAEARSITRGI